jgi:hypothetical protein
MKKKYYAKQHIAIPETELLVLNQYNAINNEQKDERGKWIKGAKRLRPGHLEIYKALLQLLMRNDLFRQNYIYQITGKGIYNAEKPLVSHVKTSDIVNMTLRGLKSGATFQTIKNHLSRLEDFKFITRSWKRSSENFMIEFNPEFIVLKDPETGKFIENIGFENFSNSIIYKSKNENLIDTTNKETKINNKTIHSSNVDNKDLLSQIIPSLKQEHLEKQDKKCNSFDPESTKTSQTKTNETLKTKAGKQELPVAPERLKDMVLTGQKKDAANKLYTRLIALFWSFWTNLYMPETAPRETLHYISESIDTLMNDNLYFGSCTNEQQINYQLAKLDKALNSTANWVKSKQKQNPGFNFQYLYPNVFLKNGPGSGKMSFKNSVLRHEIKMQKQQLLNLEFEKAMQRERDKITKQRHNLIIDNLITWIYQQPKQNTKLLTEQAMLYLQQINPELVMKLSTDIANPYRVKQAIENCKEIDKTIIDQCFNQQQKLIAEIDSLLPVMQKKLQQNKLTMSQAMFAKFKIGHQYQVTPLAYNAHTLKALKYYLQ